MSAAFNRRRQADDDDEEVERKRRRGPEQFSEVERKLADIIGRVGEKSGSSLESNLENLVGVLEADLDKYRGKIVDIIASCVIHMPEKCSIYSTLVGLLNAKNFNFGGEIVERLVSDLQEQLDGECFQKALYLVIFLCDLGNARVLSLTSVVEFLEGLVETVFEEAVPQVRTDWFAFAVLHSLPWIGYELNEKKPEELGNVLEGLGKYIEGRSKLHVKMLQVWSSGEREQEDYLDSLWAQITHLKECGWKEHHLARIYLAFDATLADALQHNLPSFAPPSHNDSSAYPYPWVVFRLFDYTDIPEEKGEVLPGAHSIERFLVEEELSWIIEHNAFNRKECAERLLAYTSRTNVPIAFMVLEVIFSQVFRLPTPPQPLIFYGSLMIELCKIQPNNIPQVLAQSAELLYQRVEQMQPVCVDRYVDWFSYHLSNFQYRWSWTDWNDCLKAEPMSAKVIFAREVLEKCARFSYWERVKELVPAEFEPLMPAKPEIRFLLDDESNPHFDLARHFTALFHEKATPQNMLAELKDKESSVEEPVYDEKSFAVFLAVLLKLASKSFSHNFAALTRYHSCIKEVADSREEMQAVVLRVLYDCWKTNHQMLIILVDKLLKMQILDCGVVVAWLFGDDLRHEHNRQWVWEVLNTALERLSKHVAKVERDVRDLKRELKKEREGDNGGEEMADASALSSKEDELASLIDFQKNLFLDVLHKLSVLLTEHIVNCETEGTEMRTPWYTWITGRFRHVFLAHCSQLWKFSDELDSKLFGMASMDANVLESFHQFLALKK